MHSDLSEVHVFEAAFVAWLDVAANIVFRSCRLVHDC